MDNFDLLGPLPVVRVAEGEVCYRFDGDQRDWYLAGWADEGVAATKPEFGHYQSNLALRIGNALKQSPRDVATRLIENLQVDDLCEKPSIAGPGFINLTLLPSTLAKAVNEPESFTSNGQRVVVDYSQPNVAKP